MTINDFVSVNSLLADITKNVNDEAYRNGFAKGWFISRIQKAMQEIAFDTFYQKITMDLDFPVDSYALDIPVNCFNLRELYLHNGDCCAPSSTAVVYWKRLGNNNGQGPAYSARVRRNGEGNTADPYQPSIANNSFAIPSGNLLWANIINGQIQFGPDCAGYSKIRLVFNGCGGIIGDEPVIPRFFEAYVSDFVCERYWRALKGRDPRQYRINWTDAVALLEKSERKAKDRVVLMNSWEKESLHEYISNILHK